MQVSIYLNEETAKKVDQKAKGARQSRSQWIQSILESVLSRKKKKTVFDEVCGVLSTAKAKRLLNVIQENRLDSPRFESEQ